MEPGSLGVLVSPIQSNSGALPSSLGLIMGLQTVPLSQLRGGQSFCHVFGHATESVAAQRLLSKCILWVPLSVKR